MNVIQNIDVKDKNVLVRVDFNVKLEDGDIRERFKMESARETIGYLQEKGARSITLLTHLGRPKGRYNELLSLSNITDDIERTLMIKTIFLEDCKGEKVASAIEKAQNGSIFLLENVRFHAEEEEDYSMFAQELAEPFNLFVNDAFSVCHRAHVSTHGITKYIPSYAGLYLQREVRVLSGIRKEVASPSVAVVGGAKIATKLPLIQVFAKTFDTVLVGGKVANELIDQKIELPGNVILPQDFEGERLDIGEKTRKQFVEKCAGTKTIVWNGPLGMFEDERYAKGTLEIARTIAMSDAFSVVGGGESIEILEDLYLLKEVGFVSTGGGAMLSYLMGEVMPGLEALEEAPSV